MPPTTPVVDSSMSWERAAQELTKLYVGPVDLRVLLVKPSYRPDRAHTVVDDETAESPLKHELTVDGYTRQKLAGARLVDDPIGCYLDASDVPFGALEPGERVGGAVLYREAGSDRLSPLIAFYALGRQGTTGGPVLVEWAAPEQGRVARVPLCSCHHARRSK
jgi:hypothetical protein